MSKIKAKQKKEINLESIGKQKMSQSQIIKMIHSLKINYFIHSDFKQNRGNSIET